MTDTLQNFVCSSCRHSVIDFDLPVGECEKCKTKDSYSHCASSVVTRLASEGIFYEFTLDSSHTYDERNDKYADEILQDQANNAYEKVRSGKAKFEHNISED